MRFPLRLIVPVLSALFVQCAAAAPPVYTSGLKFWNSYDMFDRNGRVYFIYGDESNGTVVKYTARDFEFPSDGDPYEIEEMSEAPMPPGQSRVFSGDLDVNAGGSVLFSAGNADGDGIANIIGVIWKPDGQIVSFSSPGGFVELGEINDSGHAAASFKEFRGATGRMNIPHIISPSGGAVEIPPTRVTEWGYRLAPDEFGNNRRVADNEARAVALNNQNAVACAARGLIHDGTRFNEEYWSFVWREGSVIAENLPAGATDINDHNEVVGMDRTTGKSWLYLPAANYGLSAGVHWINDHRFIASATRARINNLGDIVWTHDYSSNPVSHLWTKGTLHNLADVIEASGNPFTIKWILDLNDQGQILVEEVSEYTYEGETYDEWDSSRILSPAPVRLSLSPEHGIRHVGETYVLRVEVNHASPTPATYEFPHGPFDFDPELFTYPGAVDPDEETPPDPLFEPVAPFVQGQDDEPYAFEIPIVPLKPGVTTITTHAKVTHQDGSARDIDLEIPVLIDPLKIETKITVDPYSLNQVPESEWGDRAKQVAAQRRQQIADGTAPNLIVDFGPEPRPFRNLVELEMKLTNTTDRTIDNITVPSADAILGLIKSANIAKPGVPLFPIRYYAHDGQEDDLTISGDEPVVPDLVLAPGASATLAWVMEAYDANPDPAEDNSAELLFEPLILGRVVGSGGAPNIDLRAVDSAAFSIIDKPLLRWGIRPKDNRTTYLSGQAVRVDGYLENISAENGGTPRELLVMLYPMPEGNLGGGLPKKADVPDISLPIYYEVFRLPAEGPGRRVDVNAIFASLPGVADSTGTARYGVRLWTVDEDDTVTKADGQALLDETWGDRFNVALKANRPLLTAAEARRKEAIALGIHPLLAGIEEGGILFVEGIYGLYQMALSLDDLNSKLWKGYIAYDVWVMFELWQYSQGNPEALEALYRDAYEKYLELYNLGVLAAESVPLTFQAFSEQAGNAMSGFFRTVEEGDLEEIQFQTGKFLGANPDLALEPMMMGLTYLRLARSARVAEAGIVTDAIAAARREELVRQRASVSQRIADGKANPGVTDLSSVLRAGDQLSRRNLLEIYGIDSEQLKKLQEIARQNGVMLCFRSRSKKARDLLDAGVAWPKPQKLKFKTVNEIDITYLGYRRGAEATLEIVEPPASLLTKSGKEFEDALDAYIETLAGHHPDMVSNDVLRGEVRSRVKTRVEEWHELVPDLKLNYGGQSVVEIPTNFEADLQFGLKKERDLIPDIAAAQKRSVRTTLDGSVTDAVTGEARRKWTLAMSDPAGGNYRPVSGDVDFMAILEPNGGMILDADRRLKIYTQLAEAVDMQHGESFTFFIDKARAKYLDGNTHGQPGAEAICCISPFGGQTPTAGYFVKSLSIIKDNNSKFLPVREAIKLPDKVKLSEGKVILEEGKTIVSRRADVTGEYVVIAGAEVNSVIDLDFVNRFRPYILKETLREFKKRLPFHLPLLVTKALGLDEGSESYARPPGVAPRSLQRGADGGGGVPPLLQLRPDPTTGLLAPAVWSEGSGWSLVTTQEALDLGQPGTLDMLPMTFLNAEAPRRSTILPVATAVELGVAGDYFEIGDLVVIDPGGSREEFGTLASVEPFRLAAGLIFGHPSGTLVASLGPDLTDRDGDGVNGFDEVALGTNPDDGDADDDADLDGLSLRDELGLGTDPYLSDTDGDGIDDGDEIAIGTDPLDADSGLAVLSFERQPEIGSHLFRFSSAIGVSYQIQSSATLEPGSWDTEAAVTAQSSVSTIAIPYSAADSRRFYRVRAIAD